MAVKDWKMAFETGIRVAIDATGAKIGSKLFNASIAGMGAEAVKQGATIRTQMDKVRDTIFSVQSALLVLGIGFGLGDLIFTNARFQDSMMTVKAVIQATESDMAKMTERARQLGATTRFTASEAASGLEFLGRAGFNASQAYEALPATLNLATAASLDLGRAANIVSNIMAGFGVRASETNRIADASAAIASRANTDISQLGDAMKFAAPAAQALSVSMETTAAAIGVLSNAGIQGTLAGRALRGIITDMAAQTPKAQSAIRALGLELSQMKPVGGDIVTVFRALHDAEIDLSSATAIFGQNFATAALVLAEGADELERLNSITNNATGLAERMARMMEDTLLGSLRRLRSTIEEVFLSVGGLGLAAGFRSLTDAVTGTIRVLAGTAGPLEKNINLHRTLAFIVKQLALNLAFIVGLKLIGWFTATGIAIGSFVSIMIGLVALIRSATVVSRALVPAAVAASAAMAGTAATASASTKVFAAFNAAQATVATTLSAVMPKALAAFTLAMAAPKAALLGLGKWLLYIFIPILLKGILVMGLIAGAIAAVILAIKLWNQWGNIQNRTLEKTNKGMIEQRDEIMRLADEYEQLSKRSSLTRDEQQQLNNTVEQIERIMPGMTAGFDKVGRAIKGTEDDVSSIRVEIQGMTEDIKKNNLVLAQMAFLGASERVAELEDRVKSARKVLRDIESSPESAVVKSAFLSDPTTFPTKPQEVRTQAGAVSELEIALAAARRELQQFTMEFDTLKEAGIILDEFKVRVDQATAAIVNFFTRGKSGFAAISPEAKQRLVDLETELDASERLLQARKLGDDAVVRTEALLRAEVLARELDISTASRHFETLKQLTLAIAQNEAAMKKFGSTQESLIARIAREESQFKRLLQARKEGEDSYERVRSAIEAENLIRSEGTSLSETEKNRIRELVRLTNEHRRAISGLSNEKESFNEKLRRELSESDRLLQAQRDGAAAYDHMRNVIEVENEARKSNLGLTREQINALVAVKDQIDANVGARKELVELQRKEVDLMRQAGEKFGKSEVQKVQDRMDLLRRWRESGAIDQPTFDRAMIESQKELREETLKTMAATEDWKNGAIVAANRYSDAIGTAAETFERAFANAIRSVEDQLVDFLARGRLDLKAFSQEISAMFIRAAIQKSVVQPLLGLATAALTAGATSALGPGVTEIGVIPASSGGPAANAFTIAGASIPSFDNGGINTRPGIYYAGVREAHVPLTKFKGEKGSSAPPQINMRVNIQTNDANSFQHSESQVAGKIGNAVREAVTQFGYRG